MAFKKLMLSTAIAGSLAASGAASAITIDGITFGPGAVFETINLFEGELFGDGVGNDNGLIDQPGEVLAGIGKVTSILDTANNELWEDGDNGRELTFYFTNFVSESILTQTATDPFNPGNQISQSTIRFTGGDLFLYSDASQDFSATGTQAAGIGTAINGQLFLQMTGSPIGGFGAISGNPLTLQSVSTTTGNPPPDPLLAPGTNITGEGNLDVVGGSAATFFDTNQFGCTVQEGLPCPDTADKTFTSSGQIPVGGFNPNGWGFRGTGEVQDFAEVPEPGSLALLGLGLAGLGFMRQRRSAKA